jgi:membrane AbrB-like protein
MFCNGNEEDNMNRTIETILVTCVGGLIFTLLHIPLSWMLGPLTAVIMWTSFTRRRLVCSNGLRNVGLALLGYSMGLSITLESVTQISAQLPSMLLATLLTVAFSLVTAVITARQSGISTTSSVIGSIPGGLTQMVVLSDEVEGADTAVVAFMQTIRLLAVVFVVPFFAVHGLADGAGAVIPLVGKQAGGAGTLWGSLAAGAQAAADRPLFCLLLIAGVAASAWVAGKLRFPTPHFLGPILLVGIVTIASMDPPPLPSLFIILGQWILGTSMGLGIKLSSLSSWKRLLPYSLLSGFGIVGFSLGLSYVFSVLHPITLVTAFLSTSPGGMTEMGVTATLVGADVSLVVAYQMFRILFILFVVPYALRWSFRRLARSTKPHPSGG